LFLEILDQFLGGWLLEEVEHGLLDDCSAFEFILEPVRWILLVLSIEGSEDCLERF